MTETILAAAIAIGAALATRAISGRPRLPVLVALAAIFYPVAESVVGFVDVAPLVGQPTTLEPLTSEQLARMPWNIVEDNLLIPVLGIATTAVLGARQAAASFVDPFRRRWSAWAPELGIGWAAVPVVVAAEALALAALQGPASFLQTADESALFANATLVNVILLCLAPAFAEELYYRNFLQGSLELAWPGPRGEWAAIGLQAVLFAIAHASYTSLAHILGPLVFGLGMGYLRTTAGLGACMVGHASVNLLYFAVDPGAGSTLLLAAVAGLSIVGLVVLAVLWPTIRGRLRAGPKPVLSN